MYSTCIACHAPLGTNEVLERFPVGRKLAIDPAKGRLWVVCRTCRQWNLSPIEERWEAIEDGERLYRDSRLRTSTDNIGLARLADGTELIRVGEPQRPEFAAWRYGERFHRRWMMNAPVAGLMAGAAVVSKATSTLLFLQWAIVPAGIAMLLDAGGEVMRRTRKVVDLDHPRAGRVKLTQSHVESMRLLRDRNDPSGWQLRVQHSPWVNGRRSLSVKDSELVLRGPEALKAVTRLMPRVNRLGGRKQVVAEAVAFMERAGSPDAVFRLASRLDPASKDTERGYEPDGGMQVDGDGNVVSAFAKADASVRLAVEMAAHEEQERALLQGELADLEAQWKEAEEVASIADGLFVAPRVAAQLERFRFR